MGNMSYCRFENTTKDMQDCVNAIENVELDELNEYEISSLQTFLDLAKRIVINEDYILETIEVENNKIGIQEWK